LQRLLIRQELGLDVFLGFPLDEISELDSVHLIRKKGSVLARRNSTSMGVC
jgi:hypothetical protein